MATSCWSVWLVGWLLLRLLRWGVGVCKRALNRPTDILQYIHNCLRNSFSSSSMRRWNQNLQIVPSKVVGKFIFPCVSHNSLPIPCVPARAPCTFISPKDVLTGRATDWKNQPVPVITRLVFVPLKNIPQNPGSPAAINTRLLFHGGKINGITHASTSERTHTLRLPAKHSALLRCFSFADLHSFFFFELFHEWN